MKVHLKYRRLIVAALATVVFLCHTWNWLSPQLLSSSDSKQTESGNKGIVPLAEDKVAIPNDPLLPPPEDAEPATPKDGCQKFFARATSPNTILLGPTLESEPQEYENIPQNIFFLHYNERLMNPRYLCSLESAARQNPDHKIYLFARNAKDFRRDVSKWLSRVGGAMNDMLEIRELDWADQMMGTPLEPWWTEGRWKDSSWVDQNLGNAFRMGLIYKMGGVYMDLDIISLNPVRGLGRAISMQDKDWFNNAVFSLEKEDKFAWKMMEEFVDGFKGHIWARNGPRMVTRTYKKYCEQDEIDESMAEVCKTLAVMPTERFFPIQYEQREKLFEAFDESCDLMEQISRESVGIHWWNKRVQTSTISTKTMLTVLMKSHCPAVFESFPESQLGVDEKAKVGAPAEVKGGDASMAFDKKKNGFEQILMLFSRKLLHTRWKLSPSLFTSISSLLLASMYIALFWFSMDDVEPVKTEEVNLPIKASSIQPVALPSEKASKPESNLFGNLSLKITTSDPSCQRFLDRAASPGSYFLTPNDRNSTNTSLISPQIPKQIFFLHYNNELQQPRRLCSIESAARQNPDHRIIIYAKRKNTFETKIKKWRKNAGLDRRLVVKELKWGDAMVDTPLFEWWKERKWARSKWPEQNLGNAFRLGMLWKFGGVYSDLDIISVNPVKELGRTVARQDKKNTNNAFFSVEPRDPFIWEIMKQFVRGFRGDKWGHNGPAAVTRTLRKCKIPECQSIELADPMRFFPFNYTSAIDQTYWDDSCEMMGRIADESIGVHYWDKRLKNIQDLRKTSILRIIMISHCPVLVNTFSHKELGMRTDDSMKK
ncbi:hypothetical protein BCR33DRAFT_847427 [Rhizoclosmatium globosum]|uniref:Alpha 1,4-glycosyltransferase domain-containing protein n=1 Tax=Rhizoclosmatium globosum TaxID=329046 RepID=A0A1Y2CR64_9FUNG|nr:hypothetical protein BCR33DRAFT_847427 [Rhizoclosmatium globosum]|eukprot:ORY49453.1 hypothetical protein BCR33DRAFT_847427 [Rhizoclosmatium globosum]